MVFRYRIFIAVCLIFLLFTLPGVQAGQIASHIYTAHMMRAYLSPSCRALVDAHPDAYYAGAQGPDIVGVVQHALSPWSEFPVQTVGEEAHYEKAGQLALNILYNAKTPEEKAFALGWITHYLNDIHIHPLVNSYGGFYKVDSRRHKILELIESKYIYTEKSSIVTREAALIIPAVMGRHFPQFIFEAHHTTFPTNPLYDPNGNAVHMGLRERPRLQHFSEQFLRASSWCQNASNHFYFAHETGSGKHNLVQSYLPKFPDLPTQAQYDRLMKPLEWVVKEDTGVLDIKVTINDNRLHGRFTQEWEEAVRDAISHGEKVLPSVCTFLDDPVKAPALKSKLTVLLPDLNLDQPNPNFSQAGITPGNYKTDHIILEIMPTEQNAKGAHFTQKIPIEEVVEDGYDGGKRGKVWIRCNVKSYPEFVARVMLVEKPRFEGFDYLHYDSRTDAGAPNMIGKALLGDIFDAEFEIPENLAGKKGKRIYALMQAKEKMTPEDTMMMELGLIDEEKFRADVVIIEEKIEGTKVKAKLQVTNVHEHRYTGPAKVIMLWTNKGGSIDDAFGEIFKELDNAKNALVEIDKAMEMTEEQEAALEKKMMAYEAELINKGGLTEQEIDEAMQAKAMELMKEAGADVEKHLAKNKAMQAMDASLTEPYYAENTINLRPARVSVDIEEGWKSTNDALAWPMMEQLENMQESRTDGYALDYSVKAHFMVSFSRITAKDDMLPETFEKRLQEHSARELYVGDFRGKAYDICTPTEDYWEADNSDKGEDDVKDLSTSTTYNCKGGGEAIVKRGKLMMQIQYNFEIMGVNSTNRQGVVVCQGLEKAKMAKGNILGAIINMQRSIKVVEGKTKR